MITTRKFLAAGFALSAGLFLAACADDGSDTEIVTEATAPATAESEATDTTTEQETTTAQDTTAEQTTGEDPVFSALSAALNEHAEGIIIAVDREDDTDTYDIDLVVGEEVVELKVDADGTVREDEREREGEDVVDAQNATVTAEEAIREALDQNPEGILDDAELDENDGTLQWDISLDDADRNDLAEVTIAAN